MSMEEIRSTTILRDDNEGLIKKDALKFEEWFGNIIVVDNLPIVAMDKFEKLEGVVRKIFSLVGFMKEDGFWMPIDPESNKTLGCCFIEYKLPQVAKLAKMKANGYRLGTSYILAVNMFDNDAIEKFSRVPETKPYTPGFLWWPRPPSFLSSEKASRIAEDVEIDEPLDVVEENLIDVLY